MQASCLSWNGSLKNFAKAETLAGRLTGSKGFWTTVFLMNTMLSPPQLPWMHRNLTKLSLTISPNAYTKQTALLPFHLAMPSEYTLHWESSMIWAPTVFSKILPPRSNRWNKKTSWKKDSALLVQVLKDIEVLLARQQLALSEKVVRNRGLKQSKE